MTLAAAAYACWPWPSASNRSSSFLGKNHYEGAIQEIPDRDAENRKEALRLAGRLALHLRNLDAATQYLGTLAAMDYTYKDVAELLDKLARLRENMGSTRGKRDESRDAKRAIHRGEAPSR